MGRWAIALLAFSVLGVVLAGFEVVRWCGGEVVASPTTSPSVPAPTENRTVTTSPPHHLTTSSVSLFNGRDLGGWEHLGGGRVRVDDGLLILENDGERRPGYLLCARPPVRDFRARVECRVPTGDSGFFFRSRRHERHATEVMGPQVQLNIGPRAGLGGVFEMHGRAWVRKTDPAVNTALVAGLDWMTVTVTARGPRLVVAVNGVPTVDITDAGPDNQFHAAGRFALQIHGGGPLYAAFRRIDVAPLDEDRQP
jgi:hypothetical protein